MSSWSKNVKLTTQEINYMNDNSLRTISSILDFKKFGHKILFLPLISPEIEYILESNIHPLSLNPHFFPFYKLTNLNNYISDQW